MTNPSIAPASLFLFKRSTRHAFHTWALPALTRLRYRLNRSTIQHLPPACKRPGPLARAFLCFPPLNRPDSRYTTPHTRRPCGPPCSPCCPREEKEKEEKQRKKKNACRQSQLQRHPPAAATTATPHPRHHQTQGPLPPSAKQQEKQQYHQHHYTPAHDKEEYDKLQ